MLGELIEVKSADGQSFEAYLAKPAKSGGPGIVVLPEMFNVNASIREVADGFAKDGFTALAPDMYWRQEPRTYLTYAPENSKRGRALYDALDRDKAVQDVDACIAALRQRFGTNGKTAMIGFCMGGEVGVLSGCRLQIDALSVYYGTRLENHIAEMINLAPPTEMHFPELDPYISMDTVALVKGRIGTLPNVTIYTYPGADHAFARTHHPKFRPELATLARARTDSLFRPLFG